MNKTFIWFIFISLVYFSCNAPRDNPNDPESESFTSIEGFVQSFSLPYTPLKDVSVRWAPSHAFVTTDVNGKFRIVNPTITMDYLVFQKEGYITDSVLVVWNNSNKYSVQVNLNRLPVLITSEIYTSVINHSDNSRSFELVLKVSISDDDKDIDSVFVENTRLKIRRALEYDIINKVYQVSLSSEDISLADIEDIIGEDFIFYVSDLFGKVHNVGRDQVTRVIRSAANVLTPDNNTIVDSLPQLTWEKFQPGYSHTYTVNVYKSDLTNPQLVFRLEEIPMDSSSVKVTIPLLPSDYFWVIWTYDSFNNSCRSKPGMFSVM